MNNSNTPAILRSLIVYAICVPLAIFVGYSLSDPMGSLASSNMRFFFGALVIILLSPILLRWHMELLVFSWSAYICVLVLPGAPRLSMVMACVSLAISVLERILSPNRQFIRVPQITWPLLAFLAVVIMTAELTGGIGMKAFGTDVYGGRKYIFVFVAVASYFAVTARPIPKEKAGSFVTLFFAGAFTALIANMYPYAPSWMYPVFLLIPPSVDVAPDISEVTLGKHFPGVGAAGLAIYSLLVAKVGLRDIFYGGKPWRIALLVLSFVCVAAGGYRSAIILVMTTFLLMFFWEGLHRTPLLLVMILGAITLGATLVPLAHKLPWNFQRSLAFLPMLDLDADARQSAEDSTEWRIKLWTAMLPQIPPHLLLGKGLAFSREEFEEMMNGNSQLEASAASLDASQNSLALSADYHNGMLSVIIPFGIWGVITVVWFLVAGTWVMYRNAKYAPEHLRRANAFLFMLYLYEAVNFLSCVAGLQIASELSSFVGYLGLSIALSNGVLSPEREAVAPVRSVLPFRALPRQRPAFQR